MKKTALLIVLAAVLCYSQQWTTLWTSGSINYSEASGWFSFEKSGSTWKNRLYFLDTVKFQVMSSGYSITPQYTYNFTAAEILAGQQIYSLGLDLTGDNYTEFYVLGYYGTSTSYRVGFKIIDITKGTILYQKSDASSSYSYPTLLDVNSDGIYEITFVKYDYPALTTYYFNVVSTGISTGGVESLKPIAFGLTQNYPNPFNPATTIEYVLSSRGNVKLEIYDIRGKLVKTLLDREEMPGQHSAVWDGTDGNGLRQPSGVYFYSLNNAGQQSTRKMIMLK